MELFHYSQPQEIQNPHSDTIKQQYQASKLLRIIIPKKKSNLSIFLWLNQCSFASLTSAFLPATSSSPAAVFHHVMCSLARFFLP